MSYSGNTISLAQGGLIGGAGGGSCHPLPLMLKWRPLCQKNAPLFGNSTKK